MRNKIFLFFILLFLLFLWFLNLDFIYFLKQYFGLDLNEFVYLKIENDLLKKKILELENNKIEKKYILAKVYFKYPFNFQSKFFLKAFNQKNEEIKLNSPVLVNKSFLLGKVVDVFKDRVTILTIFDENWKSSVLINDVKSKALLIGGYEPMLNFIDKNNLPKPGDLVINIDENFPYGLIIGRIKEVVLNEAEVWAKATLELPYNLNFLTEVYIYNDL